MLEINLQLFSGGGASFTQRGGGGRDAVNEDQQKFRFYYIDENGKERFKDINAENFEQAKQYFREIAKALKAKKVLRAGQINDTLSKNVISTEKTIIDPRSGKEIDLQDSKLSYTSPPQTVDSSHLKNVMQIAKDIQNETKEHLTVFDKNGKVIYEKQGDMNSVSAPKDVMKQASSDLHNHGRGEGVIGGTFSAVESNGKGDIQSLVNNSNLNTSYASTKEGVYYISKTGDFKGKQLLRHMKSVENKTMEKMNADLKTLSDRNIAGKISHDIYMAQYNRIVNKALVKMHNEYLKGQEKYGYIYGLMKH